MSKVSKVSEAAEAICQEIQNKFNTKAVIQPYDEELGVHVIAIQDNELYLKNEFKKFVFQMTQYYEVSDIAVICNRTLFEKKTALNTTKSGWWSNLLSSLGIATAG